MKITLNIMKSYNPNGVQYGNLSYLFSISSRGVTCTYSIFNGSY